QRAGANSDPQVRSECECECERDPGAEAKAQPGDKPDARRRKTRRQISHGPGRRSDAASMPTLRRDQNAYPEHDRGRSDQVFSGQLLLRRKTGARGSDPRDVRSRLSQLYAREIADPEIAR